MGWGIFILWAEALVPICIRWETMQPTGLFSAYDWVSRYEDDGYFNWVMELKELYLSWE